MVEFPSDEPIDQDNPQQSEEEMENPQESGEEKMNPQAESVEKTLELSDDVAAQESQVKESDESSPIISGMPTSSSAINEDNVDQDDPKESDEEKENPEEASIEKTLELCDDVVVQEPQVKDSDESTPIISGSSASSSAINETIEANNNTYPSSSRKGKEICYEYDDDDDSEDSKFPYRDETSSSYETEMHQLMLRQLNARLGGLDPQSSYQFSRSDPMVNQQQQFTTLNQPFVMQQPLPTMMFPTQPRPFVVDHNYGAGFGPMSAPWRPPTIIPQGPHNIYPSFEAPLPHMAYAMTPPIVAVRGQNPDRPSGMQHQMDTDPNTVQARALCQHLKRLEDNPRYQIPPTNLPMIPITNEQNQIVAYIDQGPPPMTYQDVLMRLEEANQQNQIAPNLVMRPGTNQQNQIVPYLAFGQAPMMHQYVQMRPEANQQEEIAPYLLIRPENNQQNQIVPYLAPGQAPMMQAPMMQAPMMQAPMMQAPMMQAPMMQGPMMQAPMMQAPMMQAPMMQAPMMQAPMMQAPMIQAPMIQAPMMQAHQVPMMPRMYQQVQIRPEANEVYHIVPNLHMRPVTNQQNRIVAFEGPPMRVMYRRVQPRPEANQQYQNVPNLLPVANEQNQIFVPNVEPGLAPEIPFQHVMIGENIQQNQTDIFVYPAPMMYSYPQQQFMNPQMITTIPRGLPRASVVNMIDQASPNAAAAPRPEHNQQQMLQLQSQAQQTTQSQGFDVGSSSNQSQD